MENYTVNNKDNKEIFYIPKSYQLYKNFTVIFFAICNNIKENKHHAKLTTS